VYCFYQKRVARNDELQVHGTCTALPEAGGSQRCSIACSVESIGNAVTGGVRALAELRDDPPVLRAGTRSANAPAAHSRTPGLFPYAPTIHETVSSEVISHYLGRLCLENDVRKPLQASPPDAPTTLEVKSPRTRGRHASVLPRSCASCPPPMPVLSLKVECPVLSPRKFLKVECPVLSASVVSESRMSSVVSESRMSSVVQCR